MSRRSPLFFVLGALSALVAGGARVWVEDLGLKMTWWKWGLGGLWYALLNLTVAVAFTLRGEGERRASNKILTVFGGLTAALGALLAVILWSSKDPSRT